MRTTNSHKPTSLARGLSQNLASLWLAILFFNGGCGNGTRILPDTSFALGSSAFQALSGNCAVTTAPNGERFFRGNCAIVSNSNLGGIDSARSFAVDFALQDGGAISFSTFAAIDGTGGLNLLFQREGALLKARVFVAGRETNYDAQFSGIAATGRVQLQIDVHNYELPAHLLIWPSNAGPVFAVANKLINSICGISGPRPPERDCHNFGSAGRGNGEYLAVSLQNADLFQATISAPKYVH